MNKELFKAKLEDGTFAVTYENVTHMDFGELSDDELRLLHNLINGVLLSRSQLKAINNQLKELQGDIEALNATPSSLKNLPELSGSSAQEILKKIRNRNRE